MSSKCGVCEKTVYPMDPQINLDGSIFHKTCAKCEDCKCQITLSNFTKTGTTLLCKTHYFKKFREEGTYLGGEKFSHQSRAGAYSPPPPPSTGSVTAPVPARPSPSVAAVSASSSASRDNVASDLPTSTGSVKDRMKMFGNHGSNQTKCAQCNRSVYANDPQIVLDGVTYHKECAKCSDCKCQITIQNFTKSGTTLYCKTHYFKKFNEEGTYLGGEKFISKSTPGAFVAKKTNFSSVDEDVKPSAADTAPKAATAATVRPPLMVRQTTAPLDSVDPTPFTDSDSDAPMTAITPTEEVVTSDSMCAVAPLQDTTTSSDDSTAPPVVFETSGDVLLSVEGEAECAVDTELLASAALGVNVGVEDV